MHWSKYTAKKDKEDLREFCAFFVLNRSYKLNVIVNEQLYTYFQATTNDPYRRGISNAYEATNSETVS